MTSAIHAPCQRKWRARGASPAPKACETSGSSPIIVPMATTETAKKSRAPSPTPASCAAPARPTTAASTTPMSDCPALASASGTASRTSARTSARTGRESFTGARTYRGRPSGQSG